jgi:hypothetical protein
MLDTYTEKHFHPDIELAGLRIWIDSRKYPDHHDFWDGNWLNTTVHCSTENSLVKSLVRFSGDILRNTEIAEWLNSLEKLNEALSDEANAGLEVIPGEANLYPLENYFTVKMKTETYQRVSIKVDIFPKDIFERHYFEFWLDQSCINDLIESCRNILTKFPIRGKLQESK